MKGSDYIVERLAHWGIDTCFAVTGGGSMHLNDSFGRDPAITVHYLHHEQACAMAAEGYARIAGKPAAVNVTTGPGGINALNGVFGAYTDSIPMIVVSGQVRRDTVSEPGSPLRQLGDQEAPIVQIAEPITVWAELARDPERLPELVDAAVLAALGGRPGPAWLDVPVDVQGSDIDADPRAPLPPRSTPEAFDPAALDDVARLLAGARRPLILAGTGVRIAGVEDALLKLAERTGVPVATAWTHDVFPSDHELYAGRPGTIGTRAGNFAAQAADLILVLGSRLNIRQVSYNWASFAPHATVVWVDIDEAEFRKPYVTPDVAIRADLRTFLPELAQSVAPTPGAHEEWRSWCRSTRAQYEPQPAQYAVREGINAYHLVLELGELLGSDHVVACGNATACIVPFQALPVRSGMRLFSNSGSASMGYDLPAALGAAAAGAGRRVVCLAGDGSLMMNLQELQTLSSSGADVLLVVLDNGGYLSIRQTQQNFFGREHGAAPSSGVTFPDFARVAAAFDLPVTALEPDGRWQDQLKEVVEARGPRVCVAPLDRLQEFEPRLKSRMRDGKIETPALDDMYPHLPDDELASVRQAALSI